MPCLRIARVVPCLRIARGCNRFHRAVTGGATPRFWTPTTPPTNCWPEAPWGGGGGGGGGHLRGGFREGEWGGGYRRGWGGGGGGSGRVSWGGGGGGPSGAIRGGGGGGGPGGAIWGVGGGGGGTGSPYLPLPSSNHTITINLTLTFAATWFGHASHVDWVEQDPPN